MTDGRQRRRFLRDAVTTGVVGIAASRWTVYEPPPTEADPPRRIAHRGCACEFPENTLEAVERSAPLVDAVELDVRRAKTGELVVIHDERVDRVTDGTGAVADLALYELRELSVLDTGAPPPVLDEVFEAAPESTELVLDLKVEGIVDDAVDVAASHPQPVVLSSFHSGIVSRGSRAGAETALIVGEPRQARLSGVLDDWTALPVAPRLAVENAVERAIESGCEAIHPHLRLCLRTDVVERAHERGLAVEPWTITDPAAAAALADVGVDGLITDVCAALSDPVGSA